MIAPLIFFYFSLVPTGALYAMMSQLFDITPLFLLITRPNATNATNVPSCVHPSSTQFMCINVMSIHTMLQNLLNSHSWSLLQYYKSEKFKLNATHAIQCNSHNFHNLCKSLVMTQLHATYFTNFLCRSVHTSLDVLVGTLFALIWSQCWLLSGCSYY